VREWPQQHRSLGALVLFVLLVCGAAYLIAVRPEVEDLTVTQANVKETRSRLVQSGWPLDSERLKKLHEDMLKKLDGPQGRTSEDPRGAIGIRNKADIILRDATSMFRPKIEQFFGSAKDFVNEVSRLDYQEEYAQLERRFREHDIFLAEEILGIGEDTSSLYIYQMLLQIWTLDKLVTLASQNNLRPVKDPAVAVVTETGRRHASKLSVLPVRAYLLDREDKKPYVLEFPVRMTLRGELVHFCSFLRSLHADGNFLPISRLEMTCENPVGKRADKDGTLRIDRVEAEVECSAFFRLDERAPVQRRKMANLLPPGA